MRSTHGSARLFENNVENSLPVSNLPDGRGDVSTTCGDDLSAFFDLRNGSSDSNQIWCVFRDQAATHIARVIGGVDLHGRKFARSDMPPFRYLGNGWTDCSEIR